MKKAWSKPEAQELTVALTQLGDHRSGDLVPDGTFSNNPPPKPGVSIGETYGSTTF